MDKQDDSKLISGEHFIKSDILNSELKFNNLDDCERLLFGDLTKIEYNDLMNRDIDDIMFEDFKHKFENEKIPDDLDNDDDLDENITKEIDLSSIEKEFNKKNTGITLEEAVMDYRDGISDAFDYVYSHYRPILNRYGKRYNNEELGIELLDIVLLNAVKTFNANAKTKFNTYFWTCIHNYVNCYRIKNNAQKRAHNKDMKSLQDKCTYKGDKGEAELESKIEDPSSNDSKRSRELKLSIMSLDDCLKANEITILLKLIDNYTLQEIGNCLGVTAAAICMSLKRISNKTKAAKKLREILSIR